MVSRRREGYVEVQGLQELVRGLSKTEARKDLNRHLRQANKKTADYLLPKAQSAARALGPAAAKTLAPSLRTKGDRYAALIILGGKRPDTRRAAAGWEYGALDERQFPRPFVFVKSAGVAKGRAVGRAVRENRRDIERFAIESVRDMWSDLAADVAKGRAMDAIT